MKLSHVYFFVEHKYYVVITLVKMANDYSFYDKKDRDQSVNKITYFNILFGIPLVGFLIYLLIAGDLGNLMLILSYVAIPVLVFGVGYSLYKLIASKSKS